jgi:non-heme chloroperoxidase
MLRYLANDGASLAVARVGQGPPIILVHGFASQGLIFHHQMAALAEHFTVYAPDLRGHGASAHISHGARLSRLGRDLRDLIETLDAEKVGLVGWSMGAGVVWSYLDLFGDRRVAAHAFIDELPFVMEAAESLGSDRTKLDPAPLIGLQERFADPATRAERVEGFIAWMLHDVPPVDRQRILSAARKAATDICVGQLLDSNATDFRDLIPRLQRPTLFVGARKSFFRVEFHEWMHAHVPGSQLAICPDAGHFVLVERPQWLNRQLVPFFLAHHAGGDASPSASIASMESQG